MAERICENEFVAKRSSGRATCPDNYKRIYFDKENCGNCPKVKGPMFAPILPSEPSAYIPTRRIKIERSW